MFENNLLYQILNDGFFNTLINFIFPLLAVGIIVGPFILYTYFKDKLKLFRIEDFSNEYKLNKITFFEIFIPYGFYSKLQWLKIFLIYIVLTFGSIITIISIHEKNIIYYFISIFLLLPLYIFVNATKKRFRDINLNPWISSLIINLFILINLYLLLNLLVSFSNNIDYLPVVRDRILLLIFLVAVFFDTSDVYNENNVFDYNYKKELYLNSYIIIGVIFIIFMIVSIESSDKQKVQEKLKLEFKVKEELYKEKEVKESKIQAQIDNEEKIRKEKLKEYELSILNDKIEKDNIFNSKQLLIINRLKQYKEMAIKERDNQIHNLLQDQIAEGKEISAKYSKSEDFILKMDANSKALVKQSYNLSLIESKYNDQINKFDKLIYEQTLLLKNPSERRTYE